MKNDHNNNQEKSVGKHTKGCFENLLAVGSSKQTRQVGSTY